MKNIYLTNVSFQKVKRVSMTLIFALFALTVHAQVGIGTITPDPSAQLEIQSADKGLLIPRVTELTRTTVMLTPATGLLVYQTDGAAPGFYYYDGAAWQPLKSAAQGTIIPFASGPTPVLMTTILGGLVGTASAVGFGATFPGLTLAVPTIDGSLLTGNMAFSVPRAGIVSNISAFFSNTIALNVFISTLNVKVQLFLAPAGSNTFAPLPGAELSLGSYSGFVAVGEIRQATAPFNIAVAAGDRLMLVYSCTEPGGVIASTLVGHGSAGVEIK